MKQFCLFIFIFFTIQINAAINPEIFKNSDKIKNIDQKRTYYPYPENRVHRAGLFWMNLSNTGWFGEPWTGAVDPCTGETPPEVRCRADRA